VWRGGREVRGAPRHAEFSRWGEWFHTAAVNSGGERSWISAGVNLSMTFMGPPHRRVGLHQVVQPGRPCSFFEDDAQISAQPVDELQNGAPLGLDDTLHHDLADGVPHANRNAFHVHIHADVFKAVIKGCSFLSTISSMRPRQSVERFRMVRVC